MISWINSWINMDKFVSETVKYSVQNIEHTDILRHEKARIYKGLEHFSL